jgi:hypothetical protein
MAVVPARVVERGAALGSVGLDDDRARLFAKNAIRRAKKMESRVFS